MQLTPVTKWDRWIDELSAPTIGAADLNPEDVDLLRQYMEALEPLSEEFLTH